LWDLCARIGVVVKVQWRGERHFSLRGRNSGGRKAIVMVYGLQWMETGFLMVRDWDNFGDFLDARVEFCK